MAVILDLTYHLPIMMDSFVDDTTFIHFVAINITERAVSVYYYCVHVYCVIMYIVVENFRLCSICCY